jgi:hypothetical protein
LAPEQVKNFKQIKWDWWRSCSAGGGFAYGGNPDGVGNVSWTQIRHGGVTISPDGTTATILRPYGTHMTIAAAPTVSGVIELRYWAGTPNFNLIGLTLPDLKIGDLHGGWGASENQPSTAPAQIEVEVTNGIFHIKTERPYQTACQNW